MSPLRITTAGGSLPSTGIGHLCDHTCTVWRIVETLGSAREAVRCHQPVHVGVPCATNVKRAILASQQGGLGDSGQRAVYMDLGPTPQRRDIIQLTAGPNAPALLEVESVDRPRGHHIEARCIEWEGKLKPCS